MHVIGDYIIMIIRFVYFIPAIFRAFFSVVNDFARDMELRHRYPNTHISHNCSITKDSVLKNYSMLLGNVIFNHSQIGSYSYIGRNSLVQHTTIGNYCSIAHDFHCGLGRHPMDSFSTSSYFFHSDNKFGLDIIDKDRDFDYYLPVNIGNDVWIGARVSIMGGVTVGNGAVIAAGSVVTHDVEPYSVVGGVPANVIKMRADQNCIKRYNNGWWNMEAAEAYQKMI